MSDLMDFLRARLDEDEAVAQPAYVGVSVAPGAPTMWPSGEYPDVFVDPARVLREVEAKRRIIEEHRPDSDPRWADCTTCADEEDFSEDYEGNRVYFRSAKGFPCMTLRLLALPYADHPDYRAEWRNDGPEEAQ